MARIILFNKPFQVLSQFTDDEGRDTLADYLSPPASEWPDAWTTTPRVCCC